jgi:hypothetical protein
MAGNVYTVSSGLGYASENHNFTELRSYVLERVPKQLVDPVMPDAVHEEDTRA